MKPKSFKAVICVSRMYGWNNAKIPRRLSELVVALCFFDRCRSERKSKNIWISIYILTQITPRTPVEASSVLVVILYVLNLSRSEPLLF